MKKYFILSFIILLSFTAKSQTYVSGFISSNTTWTVANSPYIINGNAILTNGFTLTIQPGVTIKLDTNKTLQIEGELIAIGNPNARITFTSLQPTPQPGDWGKIDFSDISVSAAFDSSGNYLSGSIMKYCDVLYGGELGSAEIDIESSSPYFSHCNIMNSSSGGIYCSGSTCLVDSSVINNCMSFGLFFPCGLTIKGDTIENNINGGVNLGSGCTTEIIGNYFLSNNSYAITSGQPEAGVIISNNYFANNSGGNVIYFASGLSNYVLGCNTFINNPSVCFDNTGGQGSIINNIFRGNSEAVLLDMSENQYTYFENNIIDNNSGGIICQFGSGFAPSDGSTIYYINNNEFTNNRGESIVRINCRETNNSTYNYAELKNNNFLDDSSQIEIYDGIPFGSPNIYADSNYWGSTNTQHIDSVIYDFFDNGNLSVVYYQPILTAPVVIDTACSGGMPTAVINEKNKNIHVVAFPNPFSYSTQISLSNNLEDASLMLYNIYGQRVNSMEHISGNTILINREDLPSGVYIYEIVEKNNQITNGKLIVN